MDIIFIDDLRAQTLIGVYPRERIVPQTVEISLRIGIADGQASQTDHLADTIDYDAVTQRIRAELAARHFNLLETLAEDIAAIVLNEFHSPWVRVAISKLGVLRGVRRVGVEIERQRL